VADPTRKGEHDLLRLVYSSAAAPGLTAADLEAIAARSAERNRAAGLTGLLLHQGDGFHGILEGSRRRLFARMERIITDPRHARLDILLEAPADARRFDAWSFASLPDSVARKPIVEDFVRTLSRRLR
jgi:hypothetical protein